MKLRPLHLKGSDFGTVGGSHRIALTPGIPLSDSFLWFSSFGWQFNVTPRVQVCFEWHGSWLWLLFSQMTPFHLRDPEKYPLNATWYLWLVLSWPAGWMRCSSIRRCLDDLIFHVLKWLVELFTLFLQLLYVQLIPRVARWRGQMVIDLILSSALLNNAARDRTRFISFWSP